MASFNRVILMGNLTRDPEVKYLQSGTAVSEIGLAVNDRRKNQQGEWIDETTFVDVTLWGRTAEIANEYLSKGSAVLIEGRLKLDQWEKEGKKNYKLRVVCEAMRMVGGKGGGGGGGAGGPSGGGQGAARGSGRPAPQRPAGRPAESEEASHHSAADEFYDSPGGGGDDIPF